MVEGIRCPRCDTVKPETEFYRGGRKEKRGSYCKPCDKAYKHENYERHKPRIAAYARAYRIANKDKLSEKYRQRREKDRHVIRAYMLNYHYGMSPDEYEARKQEQGYLCAICRRLSRKRDLSVDHNHSSGMVRGLLCDPCNRGLGFFKDDPDLLMAAIDYLMLRPDEERTLALVR